MNDTVSLQFCLVMYQLVSNRMSSKHNTHGKETRTKISGEQNQLIIFLIEFILFQINFRYTKQPVKSTTSHIV